VLGIVSRYVLAAVSCISIAQFLLLLNVGTENAARLAGQALARGVISGLVAAVWFYRAKKVRPPVPANVQTQVQVAALPKSLAQPAAPPIDSVSAAVTASAPTTEPSNSSFWDDRVTGIIVAVAVVVAIGLFILVATGVFHQPWALSAETSQPRFVHQGGAPAEEMFDNKTVQACWAGPVQFDDGTAELKQAQDEFDQIVTNMEKLLRAKYTILPNGKDAYETYSVAVNNELDKELEHEKAKSWTNDARMKEAKARVEYLKDHPEEQKVHVRGLPYCSEL
jgi:hypothetical protein